MISARIGSAGHLKSHTARGCNGRAVDAAAVIDFRERIIVLCAEAQTFGGSQLPGIVCAQPPELPARHQPPAAEHRRVDLRHVRVHRAEDMHPQKLAEQTIRHIQEVRQMPPVVPAALQQQWLSASSKMITFLIPVLAKFSLIQNSAIPGSLSIP